MNITPASTLRQIMRLRPVAAEILEKEFGHACWDNPDQALSGICASLHRNGEGLAERLSRLGPVPADTVWNAKPIYYLVDHLTQNHADFREREMPAIAALLELDRLPTYPEGYVVKLVIQEFKYFQQEFLKHMEEEESFLYPKIMRNEACFRYQELNPEIHKGSVNLYLQLETHKPEAEFKRMITSIREKLRNQVLKPPAGEITAKVQAELEAFAERLLAHADLESNVLFPRAGRLEQELYEGSAPGISRYPEKI